MIAVFLAGLAARLAMLFTGKSLWGDEFYSIEYASGEHWSDVLRYCFGTNHPPLYYFLIRASAAIFGPTEVGYRAVSVAAGVLTVWIIYLIGKKCFGRTTGVLAALLAAVSPYYLQSSNEIRAYSLLTLASALAFHFLFKALKRPLYIPLFVLFASVLTYIEHMGVFAVAGITLFLLVRRQRSMLWPQVTVLIAQVPWAALVVYQALLHEKVLQVSRISEYQNAPWMIKKGAGIVWHIVCGYRFSMLTVDRVLDLLRTSALFWLEASVVVLCVGTMLVTLRRVHRSNAAFLTLAFLVLVGPAAFLLIVYPIRLDSRYLGFASPLFFVWAVQAMRSWKPRAVRIVSLAALLAANLAGSLYAIALPTDMIHKNDFKGMLAYVSKAADERAAIVGWGLIHRFYADSLGLNRRARSFEDVYELDPQNTRDLQEIWFLNEVNMHANVTEDLLSEVGARILGLGFTEAERKRFGGEDGLTMAVRYKRSGGPADLR